MQLIRCLLIKLLSLHVSGIIMPINRRIRPYPTACGVLHWVCRLWVGCGLVELRRELRALCECESKSNFHTTQLHKTTANHSLHTQCITPHAVEHGLILLMMGIMMPETCQDRRLMINIELVASCWFPSFTLCSRCTVTRT